jgi:hypothetical protein
MSDDGGDEFFVGYLPTPTRLRRFLWLTLVALLLIAGATAAVIASRMRDPGDGRWTPEARANVEGLLVNQPYPMLWTDREMLLLVGQGKVAVKVPENLLGRYVGITGSLIERPGRRMVELSDAPDAVRALERTRTDIGRPGIEYGETVHLSGEIIDPKCYLGAMKPGDGKTHKACAALCLRGGIPPMFHTIAADGREMLYLLGGSDLTPVDAETRASLIAHVGEPVTIDGVAVNVGNLPILEIQHDGIKRR